MTQNQAMEEPAALRYLKNKGDTRSIKLRLVPIPIIQILNYAINSLRVLCLLPSQCAYCFLILESIV